MPEICAFYAVIGIYRWGLSGYGPRTRSDPPAFWGGMLFCKWEDTELWIVVLF